MPRRNAFTLIELLAAISIIAVLVTASLYFVGGYVQYAQQNADKQTLTVLNDALTRYKCEGGNVAALTSGAPLSHVISALQTPVTWGGAGGISHQFLRTSFTVPAYSLYATGNNGSYMFSGYNSYTATSGGSHGGNVSHSIVNFTSTGSTTWTVPAGVYSAEVLVVAGGGGGLWGGGGGGGVLHQTNYSLKPGTILNITVGTGGATNGGMGGNSFFGGLTALGGGGGGGPVPMAGGSGGGAGNGQNGGIGTPGQGNNGGMYNCHGNGGGGGAGTTGGNGTCSSGGSGGDGLQFSTSGTPAYYGGGGSGGTQAYGTIAGTGGLGGGGVGGWEGHSNAIPGTPNTGGGGGGMWNTNNGAGGSGIVIINY